MTDNKKPGLRLFEESDGRVRKLLVDDDGTVLFDCIVSPHDELIGFMERDFKDYYEKIKELEDHGLFAESIDVSVYDFIDVINIAFDMAEELRGDFPEASYFTRIALADVYLDAEDDNSASFLLYTGAKLLDVVRTPYIAKVRMRNIMEVCFGTTEGFTQKERYEKVCTVYPALREYSERWFSDKENDQLRGYELESLFEYYAFMLMALLRSEKRITRCKHCWSYFVPQTKKKTDYCLRSWSDRKTCRVHGPNLKRHDGPAEDKYLLAFKRLRARFYERENREYANERPRFGTTYSCYEDWIQVAGEARRSYLAKEIDGEELLRRLNPDDEPLEILLQNTDEPEPLPFSSTWCELIAEKMDFDSAEHFVDVQFLDLRVSEQTWRVISAEERAAGSKQGDLSLREKYKKE